MKKWWEKLVRRLEGISRRDQTVFYLTWSVLLSFGIWMRLGYPLPVTEMNFYRIERTHLLPRSEIVLNSRRSTKIQWHDLPDLHVPYCTWMVGETKDHVHVVNLDYRRVESHPLEAGITAVPVYNESVWWPAPEEHHSGVPVMFFQVPEETDRAVVEIDAVYGNGENLRYRGEGWRLSPGRWIFAVDKGESFTGGWNGGGSYTLTLYGEDGSLLLEKSGTLEGGPDV